MSTFYLLLTILHITFNSQCVNAENITLWGPGLKPDEIVLPTRYFFIELNNNDSEETTRNYLKVSVNGEKNNRHCRIRTNLLNRRNGVYIFRYKLYENCDNLQIIVMYNNVNVGGSPYNFSKVHSEDCNCPIDMNLWLDKMQCNIPNQITEDLSKLENINWTNLREQVIARYDSPGSVSLCHYVFNNNLLYGKCYGKYTGFRMFIESMLLSLSRKVILPDVEFFVNLGDWPLSSESAKYPIFSWCGSDDSFDIVMPTYDISESTLENLGRVTLDMLSVQGHVEETWENRISKAFWRGRDSNKERLKLIDISRKHPDLYNVSLTNFFFFRDKEAEYGPKVDHVSFFKFFNYKYLINVDGTVAAYRMPYLLAGGSLVFKQKSKYYEHFYNNLTANKHYIPIEKDLSDLTEKIKWAISNDAESYKIASEGQKFAINNLLPANIFCYYGQLLNEFSKIIVSSVSVLDGMQLITNNSTDCNCGTIDKDEL